MEFTKGNRVKVVDGPFLDFIGRVSDVCENERKVQIAVLFFGRDTRVLLDYPQVRSLGDDGGASAGVTPPVKPTPPTLSGTVALQPPTGTNWRDLGRTRVRQVNRRFQGASTGRLTTSHRHNPNSRR